MTPERFQDAMCKGLGRAVLWLKEHDAKPYYDAILHCCLRETAYDVECEGTHAVYVFGIVELTGDVPHFRGLILQALSDSRKDRDTRHLFEMARLLAQRGDAEARRAMYEKFDRNDAEGSFAGADEIIVLDRFDGLLRVADRIGAHILSDAAYRDWGGAVRVAEDELGDEETARTLRAATQTNERIRAYLDNIAQTQQEWQRKQSPSANLRRCPYDRLRAEIDECDGKVAPGLLFTWGRHASKEDVIAAASDLLAETRPQRLLAYLRVFMYRRFPLDPAKLLVLAQSDDAKVVHAAFWALRHVRDEAVRGLALERIGRRESLDKAVLLLANNYRHGDAACIEAALRHDLTQEEIHGVALHLCDVFEASGTQECVRLLEWSYEHTPCSMCRGSAFRRLLSNDLAPEWMVRECLYDCYDETRKLAEAHTTSGLSS